MPDKIFSASDGPTPEADSKHLKKMFFARREKSVERERIFANMGVNQQSDFGVQIAKRGVGRERNQHNVADAADVNEHLIRSLVGKPPAQLANHRSQYCRLIFACQTRRGWG